MIKIVAFCQLLFKLIYNLGQMSLKRLRKLESLIIITILNVGNRQNQFLGVLSTGLGGEGQYVFKTIMTRIVDLPEDACE